MVNYKEGSWSEDIPTKTMSSVKADRWEFWRLRVRLMIVLHVVTLLLSGLTGINLGLYYPILCLVRGEKIR